MNESYALYHTPKIEEHLSSGVFKSKSTYDAEVVCLLENITTNSDYGPGLSFESPFEKKDSFSILESTLIKDNFKKWEEVKKHLEQIEKKEFAEISKVASKLEVGEIEKINSITNKNSRIKIVTNDENYQFNSSSGSNVEIEVNKNIPESVSAIFILNHNSVHIDFFERLIENREFEIKINSTFNIELVKKYVYILEK